MRQVLITGGLGFIGSNFIRYALDKWKSLEILNLDSFSYGANPQNLVGIDETRYRFVKGSTTDSKTVEKLVGEVEMIVHFAAETHVDRSISNPEPFLQSNVMGTFTLLEAARRRDVKKFVHISTDEVYGSAPAGESFDEDHGVHASSPYSASKAAADMFVEAYHRTYGLNTVTLRCTNNFGPHQLPEKFIPKIVIRALRGETVPLYGSGMQVRDWIYVLDFCKAIELAAEKAPPGLLYNVSGGNEISNAEVAKQTLDLLWKTRDLLEFVEDRPGHDHRYSLDCTRIRTELGWKPDHAFRDALRQTVEWYVKNEWWWKPLINNKILSKTPWKENW